MRFMWRVVFRAQQRQNRTDAGGFISIVCARCGAALAPAAGKYAVPRIPKEIGGRATIDNCVILCRQCRTEIGEDTTKAIPYSSLPFFQA